MRGSRKIEDLISLISKLSHSESMKVDYILNNLNKMNNLHNLNLSDDEKRLLRKYQNKSIGHLKMPNDIRSSVKPRFDQ